ncbi:hypothetical protein [Aestuariivirga litoralis]|uniref:hypothetical protein n=1 Tax=Aestuariivirga litoralis TaxID=2650924 RepID=UPI0018C4930E|nr:hypothetical protein [Aestuariivirga litoralis]MBG1232410.1 hypothetical protein [Aestuariivirga litoralis]
MSGEKDRVERLQIMLSADELQALDNWRFSRRMPSRAAAVRELLRLGLAAEGVNFAGSGEKSSSFGMISPGVTKSRGEE